MYSALFFEHHVAGNELCALIYFSFFGLELCIFIIVFHFFSLCFAQIFSIVYFTLGVLSIIVGVYYFSISSLHLPPFSPVCIPVRNLIIPSVGDCCVSLVVPSFYVENFLCIVFKLPTKSSSWVSRSGIFNLMVCVIASFIVFIFSPLFSFCLTISLTSQIHSHEIPL